MGWNCFIPRKRISEGLTWDGVTSPRICWNITYRLQSTVFIDQNHLRNIRKWGWETLYTALPAAAPDDKTTEPRTGDPLKKDINAFNSNVSFFFFYNSHCGIQPLGKLGDLLDQIAEGLDWINSRVLMGPLFHYILDIFYVNSITLNILNLYHLDALHISQKSNSSCAQYHR